MYASKGTKISEGEIAMNKRVIFAHPNNGWPEDIDHAAKYLVPGRSCTVIEEQIGAWVTVYTLKEYEKCGPSFNSVQFEELVPANNESWRG
jgi:hypothetical protein